MTGNANPSPATCQYWFRGPAQGLAALVSVHLVLAALQAVPLPYYLQASGKPWLAVPGSLAANMSEAVISAQLTLIGAYAMLGSGMWLIRLGRAAVLLVWFVLAQMVGSYLFDGGRDLSSFHSFFTLYIWLLAVLLVPLLAYRLVTRRCIARPAADAAGEAPRLQFRIRDLLWITAEAAVALALIRALLPWDERRFREDFWSGVGGGYEYLSPVTLVLTMLAAGAAIALSLQVRSVRRAAAWIAIWECVLAAGFIAYLGVAGYSDPDFLLEIPSGGLVSWILFGLGITVFCWTAGLVVWLTLAYVRWLGYDFLRFPPRGAGRQSSAATSSP
jgi:hypothetical protein